MIFLHKAIIGFLQMMDILIQTKVLIIQTFGITEHVKMQIQMETVLQALH